MKRSLMKDGKMLRECIEQYKYYSSGNNQMVVYTCLRDSRVFVPWRASRVNDMAFVKQNGKRYLPVFSNEAQEGEAAGRFEMAEKDFVDVGISLAHLKCMSVETDQEIQSCSENRQQ